MPRSSRQPTQGQPFHVELHRLRESAYILECVIANHAGCTVGQYRATELGEIPLSRKIYDAAVHFFPQLKSYPAPGPDPVPHKPGAHPAVVMELERRKPILALVKQLHMGTKNLDAVAKLVKKALDGEVRHEDPDWMFGDGA